MKKKIIIITSIIIVTIIVIGLSVTFSTDEENVVPDEEMSLDIYNNNTLIIAGNTTKYIKQKVENTKDAEFKYSIIYKVNSGNASNISVAVLSNSVNDSTGQLSSYDIKYVDIVVINNNANESSITFDTALGFINATDSIKIKDGYSQIQSIYNN